MVMTAFGHVERKHDRSRRRRLRLLRVTVFAIVGIAILILEVWNHNYVMAAEKRPFTVSDMIEMTEIVEPLPMGRSGQTANFAFSPNGDAFAVVMRRGDLKRNKIDYNLHIYKATDVLAYVNAKGKHNGMPKSRVLVTHTTGGSRPGIEQVRWIGNGSLSYIGRTNDSAAGISYIDVETRRVTPKVQSDNDIYGYTLGKAGGTILYAAAHQPDWTQRNHSGYVVQGEMAHNLSITDPRERPFQTTAVYLKRAGDKSATKLELPDEMMPVQLGTVPWNLEMSLSPDGKWAVAIAPVRSIGEGWERYDYLSKYLSQVEAQLGPQSATGQEMLRSLVDEKSFAKGSNMMKQFYLVDTQSGRTRPLVEAPIGNRGRFTKVLWSPDGRSVIVTPTYLPLATNDAAEASKRATEQAAVEVDLASGRYRRVTGRNVKGMTSFGWWSDGTVFATWAEGANKEGVRSECYVRKVDSWAPVGECRKTVEPVATSLALDIAEGMNQPPELRGHDRTTGAAKIFTDLNPQLQMTTLGHEETFSWKDRQGRVFTGGLVYPPDFRKGARYAVVLQVNDFSPSEFLTDGARGMSTAYAARPIANRGMLVLQLPAVPVTASPVSGTFDWEVDSENQRFNAMIEGAIDALDNASLIDRARVGLIGFSRGGMNTLHAITFSKYPIAAATIAHGIQTTPWGYAVLAGSPFPLGMYAMEGQDVIGAPFWADGIKVWMERSPAFHLDRIRSAVRFEHIAGGVAEYWDTFANLKRHQRAVEMIHLPFAVHQLEPPAVRYTSQQGNVDWYAFWLLGEEDPDPAKRDQYERWRKLKVLQDRVVATQ